MTTENELIGFVLDNFQATGTGQAPSSEDLEKVRPYLAGVFADLAARGVIYVADGESVPDGSVHWVAALVAQTPGLRRNFGEPQDIPSVQMCEMRLRQQRSNPSYAVVQACNF